MVWDGAANFKYAEVEGKHTRTGWRKWAETAFEPPGPGMKWKIKIDNMQSYYLIMLVPTKDD